MIKIKDEGSCLVEYRTTKTYLCSVTKHYCMNTTEVMACSSTYFYAHSM